MAEIITINPQTRAVRAETVALEVKRRLGDQLISVIYRERIRAMRTRSYRLDAPIKKAAVEVMLTLLGVELKVGKRRVLCPYLATGPYLSVFARPGVAAGPGPFDITPGSRVAEHLESLC